MKSHSLLEEAPEELDAFFGEVNHDAANEKMAVTPLNAMSSWWGRKPISTSRALILAATMPDMETVKRLYTAPGRKPFEHIPDMKTAREHSRLRVWDPFAGAGNIAFAASQLGHDVWASDYNPWAHILQRTILDWPSAYGLSLHADVKDAAGRLLRMVRRDVGRHFGVSESVYFWCWCVRCIYCDRAYPLMNHADITRDRETGEATLWMDIRYRDGEKNFMVVPTAAEPAVHYTQKGGLGRCPGCMGTLPHDKLTEDIRARGDRRLVLVERRAAGRRDYRVPTEEDQRRYAGAADAAAVMDESLMPDEEIPAARGASHPETAPYGITRWAEFYDPRQRLVLDSMLRGIREICDGIRPVAYRLAVASYLTQILVKRATSSCYGVIWHAGARNVNPSTTAFRRMGIAYNYVESNPFGPTRGIPSCTGNVLDGLKFALRLHNRAVCQRRSVLTRYAEKYDLIVTDPPYGDDVQYGELSMFYYVWAVRALAGYDYLLPKTVHLHHDLSESPGRSGRRLAAEKAYRVGLRRAFRMMADSLTQDGMLITFFNHSNPRTVTACLDAIRLAGLDVTRRLQVHTESTSAVMSRGKDSLMDSIVLVCRKK